MSRPRRPLLHVHEGDGLGEHTWLEDEDLAAIPTVRSTDDNGLSRIAKAVYRQRRDGRDGRRFPRSWKSRNTIADALDVDYDTVLRADKELERKGYLREAGLHNGRSTIFELTRGPDPTPQAPQSAVLEEVPPERGSLTGAESRSGVRTEAEPTPAEAGSASVKRKRRTGWRFVRSQQSGTWVRDPDGCDPLPSGYFAPLDIPPVATREEDEIAARPWDAEWLADCSERAESVWRRLNGFDAAPEAQSGACDDGCGHVGRRLQLGVLALCQGCWSRRRRASTAAEATGSAEWTSPNERELPTVRATAVLLPPGVRL